MKNLRYIWGGIGAAQLMYALFTTFFFFSKAYGFELLTAEAYNVLIGTTIYFGIACFVLYFLIIKNNYPYILLLLSLIMSVSLVIFFTGAKVPFFENLWFMLGVVGLSIISIIFTFKDWKKKPEAETTGS